MVVETTDLERQAIYLKLDNEYLNLNKDNAKNGYAKYEKKIFFGIAMTMLALCISVYFMIKTCLR
jgi:hypothetical protein